MNETSRILELVSSSLEPMALALLQVTIPLTIISFLLGLVLAVLTAVARIANFKRICTLVYASGDGLFAGCLQAKFKSRKI